MISIDRVSWRLGWLAVGLLGLIVLTLLPARVARPPADTDEALIEALWRLDEATLRSLLDSGLSADRRLDARDTRPLHLLFFGPGCSLNERPSAQATGRIAALLIERGADVNVPDRRGNTPLMLAAAECDAPTVRVLLEAGADMHAENILGLTAFELTLANASDAADALLEAGFTLSPEAAAHYRALYHDEAHILELIERAAPP